MSSKPILFCDYHGVLCHSGYWRSLPTDKRKVVQDFLFLKKNPLVDDWVRGKYTAEEINRIVATKLDMDFDSLWTIFVDDCKKMKVSTSSLENLNALRDKFIVILITGNMDSFSRFTVPALGLDKYFDVISNSFYERIDKNDEGGKLFLKYTHQFDAPIGECILLDDSIRVHGLFEKLGGKAYLVTENENLDFHLGRIMK